MEKEKMKDPSEKPPVKSWLCHFWTSPLHLRFEITVLWWIFNDKIRKVQQKMGSEGCYEINSVGEQTLTDLWVWEHLKFEVCKNGLTLDLGSIAGNLSFLTFLSCQQWLNGFSKQACVFICWFLNLFPWYSTNGIGISLSCISSPLFVLLPSLAPLGEHQGVPELYGRYCPVLWSPPGSTWS